MFEEICLTCGKHLKDDGRVYCSDECQNLDATSPCISSASSTFSSPYLGYAVGGDVPPLIPSALGTALNDNRSRDRYSVSSSSASSTSWSVLTDEEDDAQYINSDYGYLDGVDSSFEGNSKSTSGVQSVLRPAPLSYARRPSGTNNGPSVPHLHRRTSSGSFSGHVRGAPRSAPIRFHSHSSNDDEEAYFDFTSRDDCEPSSPHTVPDNNEQRKSTLTKSKRAGNRASLPACFSLLQLNNGSPSSELQTRASPSAAACSTQTVVRASPPTPKLTIPGMPFHTSAPTTATMQVTPRGRRRGLEDSSRISRVFDDSSSSSRSRSRSPLPFASEDDASRLRVDSRASKGSKGSVEQVFDWSSLSGLPRGRTTVRRNSSPPPKVMLSRMAMEEFSAASGSRSSRQRGRMRAEDLDRFGDSKQAPGYGQGRSGLLDRERTFSQRGSSRPSFLL